MNKTSSVFVRIDPRTKEKAEKILNELGISASTAINMFYKQIIIQNGMPFDVKCSNKISNIRQEDLDEVIFEASKQDMTIAEEIVEEITQEIR